MRVKNEHQSPATPRDVLASSGYEPGDDGWTIVKNLYRYLKGDMTDAGIARFRRDSEIRNEATDCKRCEESRDYLLQYSPIITFLRDNIRQLGGDITRDKIFCRRCDTEQGSTGGFDPNYGIVVCANLQKARNHVEDTLAHEMVHLYDYLRFKVDWSGRNLRHAACAEIRASSLSGECRFSREFWTRRQWKLTQQHQECVRRRAITSLTHRPACRDREHAAQIVDEVWESCFRDTRPFDEIYR
ncbi:Mitochondrial inner membrane protease atp23 [Ascosphaera acerosa]|nr:Mitochondrial inner membrane protease atp23 [Ascosphaera acerosa]